MQEKKRENNVGLNGSGPNISHRKFWRLILQIRERDFNFRIEYKKWLWKKSEKKQYVLELYCFGYNQLEIASILLISPLKVRKVLRELRRSLEWNIKTLHLLED